MKKCPKEAFSDWRKPPSSVAIDNGTETIGYWKASLRVKAFVTMVPKNWQSSCRISSAWWLLFIFVIPVFVFLYRGTYGVFIPVFVFLYWELTAPLMGLSFIKALYYDTSNSGAWIISETISASMILSVVKCLGPLLEKGSMPYISTQILFQIFYMLDNIFNSLWG